MNHLKVNLNQAKELVTDFLLSGLTPMLHSSPGLGKSSLVRQIAEEYNLYHIDCRLTNMDPTDFNGLIFKNQEGTKSTYLPLDYFPLEDTPIPKGYSGWLICLDELSSAPLSIQAACYKLVLDRMVGNSKLHSKVKMIACGNLMTDKAIVTRQSTAMQSRMAHLVIHSDLKVSLDHFNKCNFDSRIVSFLQFRPNLLHNFDPNHSDLTFPCPRTWEFVNNLLTHLGKNEPIEHKKLPAIAGLIGQGSAREFLTYTEIFSTLPQFTSILSNPDTAVVPTDPSSLYAVTGMLTDNITKDNLDTVSTYLDRLPIEFTTITLQNLIRKNNKMFSHPTMAKWVDLISEYL